MGQNTNRTKYKIPKYKHDKIQILGVPIENQCVKGGGLLYGGCILVFLHFVLFVFCSICPICILLHLYFVTFVFWQFVFCSFVFCRVCILEFLYFVLLYFVTFGCILFCLYYGIFVFWLTTSRGVLPVLLSLGKETPVDLNVETWLRFPKALIALDNLKYDSQLISEKSGSSFSSFNGLRPWWSSRSIIFRCLTSFEIEKSSGWSTFFLVFL